MIFKIFNYSLSLIILDCNIIIDCILLLFSYSSSGLYQNWQPHTLLERGLLQLIRFENDHDGWILLTCVRVWTCHVFFLFHPFLILFPIFFSSFSHLFLIFFPIFFSSFSNLFSHLFQQLTKHRLPLKQEVTTQPQ